MPNGPEQQVGTEKKAVKEDTNFLEKIMIKDAEKNGSRVNEIAHIVTVRLDREAAKEEGRAVLYAADFEKHFHYSAEAAN